MDHSFVYSNCEFGSYNPLNSFPRRRRRLSAAETKLLSDIFTYNQKPNAQLRAELGIQLNMTPRAVQIW